MNRRLCALLLAALVVVALATTGSSSARFTATSSNAVSTVSAAADWTPPSVSVTAPASPLKGTATVAATASDGETGIASVAIASLAPGGSSWVTLCTDTSAPYSCDWTTTAVADGTYTLRAVAIDNAGYATTSETVKAVVANATLVTLGDPGEVVRGTVSLPVTITNGGSLLYAVRVEYAVAGTGTWKTLCTGLLAPYSCTWATTLFANDYVDLRAVATTGTTSYTSAAVSDVLVDNRAPAVTMTDPGTPLSGVRTFAATATDDESGVAQVVLQSSSPAAAGGAWTSLCTITSDPYSCRIDTTTLPNGTYAFRAVATDVAGNATTSAAVTGRVVDNTVSSVSVEDPGAFLRSTVTVSANASSTAGVTSVRIQRAPAGGSTWTDLCTDGTAPYSCAWDTTAVADGLYDLRAVLVDGAGRTTTSSTVSSRRVDNSPLRALDVQALNGGPLAGRLDTGDALTFTWSTPVSLTSVASGWNGSAVPVTLRVRDGNLVGAGNKGDVLDVSRAGGTLNLGSVSLREDFVKSRKTVSFNATMTAGTATVNGATVTTVTLTLGTASGSTSGVKTTSLAGAMVWTPSAAVTDQTGKPSSAATATESGPADRDF